MEQEIVSITVYDKRVQMTWEMYVVPLGDQVYRAVENELFGEITIGTEFRTWINKDDAHQIVKILKRSPYITRRFMLSLNIPTADSPARRCNRRAGRHLAGRYGRNSYGKPAPGQHLRPR